MTIARWQNLSDKQQTKFIPLCPDFLIELLSPTDSLKATQTKMQEYQENGLRLGWLIDRKAKRVEVYRQGQEKEILNNPQTLSGENILPKFTLDLLPIWSIKLLANAKTTKNSL